MSTTKRKESLNTSTIYLNSIDVEYSNLDPDDKIALRSKACIKIKGIDPLVGDMVEVNIITSIIGYEEFITGAEALKKRLDSYKQTKLTAPFIIQENIIEIGSILDEIRTL